MNTVKLFLKVKEAAPLMGLSVTQTYRLVNSGRLPAIRQGHAIRIPAEAFEKWVHGLSEAALAAVNAQPGTGAVDRG